MPVAALGTLLAMHLTRDFLLQAKAIDASVIPLVALFVTANALMACWIPARKAIRMDPLIALRRD